MTRVPKTSRYRFFILNNLNNLSGLNRTKNVADGKRHKMQAATSVITEVPKSKRFHPELRYRLVPSPSTLISASVTNTIIKNSIIIILLLHITFTNTPLYVLPPKRKVSQDAANKRALWRLSLGSNILIIIAIPFATIVISKSCRIFN